MTSQLIEEVLISGSDDWVYLAEIHRLAFIQGGARNEAEAKRVTIETIRDLVESDFVEIGDVTDGGFFEWNLPLDQALKRIGVEWENLDHEPWPGDICWLANTLKGDRRAEEITRERDSRPRS